MAAAMFASYAAAETKFSTHSASAKVAKPSLSQMSRKSTQVTQSPHHWCASSCTHTDSYRRSPRSRLRRSVVIVWCSMPPAPNGSTVACPYLSNG